jgi:hypothetical protein
MTPSVLIWYGNGAWAATVVTREATKHDFPMPHTDLVEQFIKTSLGDSPMHGGEEKRQGDSLAIVVQMY